MTPTSRATDRFDVAIIGAGPAGIAAASAAAQSASVLLIEASDRLGGSVTAAMHRCMCGLYSSLPKDPLDTLNDFTQRDLVRRMLRKEPAHVIPRQFGQAPVLEFPRAVWESSLAEICAESNADLRLGCRLVDIRREKDRLTAIQIADPDPQWVSVNAVIDCTGGGHGLKLLGSDACQPPEGSDGRTFAGFAVRLSGLNTDPEMLRLQIPYALAKAVDAGHLPPNARFTVFYPGPGQGEGICKLAVNPAEISPAEADELAERIVRLLIAEVPAFKDAKIAEKSPRILPARRPSPPRPIYRHRTGHSPGPPPRPGFCPRLVAHRNLGYLRRPNLRLSSARPALRHSRRCAPQRYYYEFACRRNLSLRHFRRRRLNPRQWNLPRHRVRRRTPRGILPHPLNPTGIANPIQLSFSRLDSSKSVQSQIRQGQPGR